MKIHEYQAKEIFSTYGIPVEQSIVCRSVEDAVKAYSRIDSQKVIVKAQVHTGGRGKAGGVKLANDEIELRKHAAAILGMNIKGFTVDRILVGQAVNIAKEFYVSYVIDRRSKSAILMLSKEGGMDIEEVAKNTPEKIYKFAIDPSIGVPDYLAREAAFKLFNDINLVRQAAVIIQKLYKLFRDSDASLAEINPLVLTEEGNIVAIDAKMTFDDNALFRHPKIAAINEPTEEEKKELFAKSKGFSYVHLGGEIGCMVNGAGLAMATMDIIKLYGGNPANFLDIGGSSSPTKVIEAMKLLLSDKNVKVVLINIFGGITRCDDVAKGLLEAFEQIRTNVPVVIRLTGTNEKEGRALLKNTDLHVAKTMSKATRIAVELAEQQQN
ncbi:MAG: ADP-forming succinate--CoA ligase subunit beta [Fermentimonas sp.]|jgi:succinyl-CoA synthetase beta subunit|nr:ADP-forming succinate--CoA ligase subunit beta [Fermentimonas sp.]NLC85918.1 ADP-forming succinate--CoA ligase subunit beta [Bacteroidales bacterium]HBT86566.1 ADP-forming succinate--CoA ligase subunit beta [Porphyromonadaceae bacterium]MDD2930460.1 ADP-forming succinate--CoA ligase subunit beta [Fermentimonas sp.]MDD3188865.1 ADP-forming succinate--CoA ligase subunit beta [Fermentimonas sp.]